MRVTMPSARGPHSCMIRKKVGDAEPRASAHQGPEREQALAEEGESHLQCGCGRDGAGADPREPGRPRVAASGMPFGDGLRHRNQPSNTFRESCAVDGDPPMASLAQDLEYVRDEARVPRRDLAGVEGQLTYAAGTQLS